MTTTHQKKIKLGVASRQTKSAPFWAVLKKFGTGTARFHNVSQITKHRRNWRRTKLKLKPRRVHKQQLG